MRDIKQNPIGIYEKAIPNSFSWDQKIKVAKKAGFDFIEMSVDESDERLSRLDWTHDRRQEFKKMLMAEDFEIRSMCLSGHRRFPFGSRDEKVRGRAYEIMDKALKLAVDLGIKNIQLAGYDVYYEESDSKTKECFLQGLKYAAERAAASNIMLSIEIMDTELIGTISRCLPYIEAVDSPWLNIYPDLGNLSRWTNDPCGELELGRKYIVAVHLKDTKPGIFKCVPFGEGTVNFPKLFTKLKELEYSGPFLVEMWADNESKYDMAKAVDEIKTAKEWLRSRM